MHAEHCLVEIVDEQGKPCPPGRTGRIVATNLTNLAMPLLRYDSGDLAEATGGPCPCGRTLPTFGAVAGRYARFAFVPEGTFRCLFTVVDALAEMPAHQSKGLRKYQTHQFRDGSFELRLVSVAPLPAEFFERIKRAWHAALGSEAAELRIRQVDEIPVLPGRKFYDFTSDFFPEPDQEGPEEVTTIMNS